jgi:F0F1-type ATP synthase epsilon subunit
MELSIVSPEAKHTFSIVWLEAQTSHGSFVIQPGHAPVILILTENEPVIFMLKNGKRESMPIGRGIMEIRRTTILIIMHEMA